MNSKDNTNKPFIQQDQNSKGKGWLREGPEAKGARPDAVKSGRRGARAASKQDQGFGPEAGSKGGFVQSDSTLESFLRKTGGTNDLFDFGVEKGAEFPNFDFGRADAKPETSAAKGFAEAEKQIYMENEVDSYTQGLLYPGEPANGLNSLPHALPDASAKYDALQSELLGLPEAEAFDPQELAAHSSGAPEGDAAKAGPRSPGELFGGAGLAAPQKPRKGQKRAAETRPTKRRRGRRPNSWKKEASLSNRNNNIINSNNVYINTASGGASGSEPGLAYPPAGSLHQRRAHEGAVGLELGGHGLGEGLEGFPGPSGGALSSPLGGFSPKGFPRGAQPNEAAGASVFAAPEMLGIGAKRRREISPSYFAQPAHSYSPLPGDAHGADSFPDSYMTPNSPLETSDAGGAFTNEQQMKMFQSVKMMQQSQASNDLAQSALGLQPSPQQGEDLDGSKGHLVGGTNFGTMSRHSEANPKEDKRTEESVQRIFRVQKCVEELEKMHPRYRMAVQTLSKTHPEETNVVVQAVRLYSQVLCNWKKQTMFVYSRMRASLITKQYHLENEMARGRLLKNFYENKVLSSKKRNDMLEIRIKKVQSDIQLHSQQAQDTETKEKLKMQIQEKNYEIKMYKKQLDEYNRKLKQMNDQIANEETRKAEKAAEEQLDPNQTLEKSVTSAKQLIEKLYMIRNHKNILCLNDARNLNSPIIKPDIAIISRSLMKSCREISRMLKDESQLESFLSQEAASKQCAKGSKNLIGVEQILDRRVSPEGKTQFYVSCPVASSAATPLSPDSDSTASEEGNDMSYLQEKVWVDEGNLVGCEKLIRDFSSEA